MNSAYRWREAPEAEFAVIGDPVSHSLSPKMHQAAYRALRLIHKYNAIQVPLGEVDQALSRLVALGYQGINVTVPLKEEALEWCDTREPLAAQIRAANTLRLTNRECINTDVPGFLDTIEPFVFINRTALVLGAGGSARAIAAALLLAGFDLFLYNRTTARAEALGEEIGIAPDHVRVEADPAGVSLLVNTTSASLNNDDVPILWDRAEPETLAYDLMYAAEPTPFLRAAASRDLRTMDGRKMLVAQGARSFEWWLGIEAPQEIMLEALL